MYYCHIFEHIISVCSDILTVFFEHTCFLNTPAVAGFPISVVVLRSYYYIVAKSENSTDWRNLAYKKKSQIHKEMRDQWFCVELPLSLL